MFRNFGRTTVSEFLGDRIVFRNLVPPDASLPALADLSAAAGLPDGVTPRKTDAAYARVIVELLKVARRQDGDTAPLRRLIFIGDTRMLDGTAFANICQAGGWPGIAFIGSENSKPLAVEHIPGNEALYLSNRWAALEDFDRHCAAAGLPIDAETAVVLDLDKTTLGARGRNADLIDRARIQGVEETVAGLLGADFVRPAFLQAYQSLNHPEFHPFTADNQDYLAYICLVVARGLFGLDEVMGAVRSGDLTNFHQFIERADRRAGELPAGLAGVHAEIYASVQRGDPTPFKAFRRNEYRLTVGSMGCVADDAPVEQMLAGEIVITQEVRHWSLEWRARGALLFGLSDKPDEASIPTAELAAQGWLPIHRMRTHSVGTHSVGAA